ncbi:MAG: hypothetical protein IJX39_08520 [Clostridia bacterium]|nr:hypothetical protein [Clostridia bacterium]
MSFPIRQHALLRGGRGGRVFSVSFGDTASVIGVREDAARGMVADVATGSGRVRNDFDRIPIFERPIFNATWDRAARQWIRLTPLGAEGFSWSPVEPYREVVYRCRPFWYKLDMSGSAAPLWVSVSETPRAGYTLAPMFRDGERCVYRPVFEMSVGEDGLPHSRAGALPKLAKQGDLMAAAHSYDSAARLESIKDWFSDMLLLLVEFATWSPGVLMSGNTGTELLKTGTAAMAVTASAGTPAADSACIWRGKENPWKNACSCLCDILIRRVTQDTGFSATVHYLPDISHYDGTVNAHYRHVAPYVLQTSSYIGVGGFAMGEGFLYPATAVTDGVAAKSYAYLNAPNDTDSPIAVGVGGSSIHYLLPTDLLPSPFHWEGMQLDAWRSDYLGARLVLDEA